MTIAQLAGQPLDGETDCRTQLLEVADVILRNAEFIRRIVPFLLLEVRQHPEVARLATTHTFGPLLLDLTALFEKHAQSGELRPGSAAVRAEALVGLIMAIMLIKPVVPHLLPGDDEEVFREQIDILLHGILAHP